MSAGAWIMLAFGCALLYGGVAYCLYRAMGARRSASEEESQTEA